MMMEGLLGVIEERIRMTMTTTWMKQINKSHLHESNDEENVVIRGKKKVYPNYSN
jgi:hypothetical protein